MPALSGSDVLPVNLQLRLDVAQGSKSFDMSLNPWSFLLLEPRQAGEWNFQYVSHRLDAESYQAENYTRMPRPACRQGPHPLIRRQTKLGDVGP